MFLVVVIAFGLAECAARLAEWAHPARPELTFEYAPYRMLRMTHAPWPLNSEGFRAQEFARYKGKFLIEFLGGSVCLGVGTNPGKTVPERLEEMLHRADLAEVAVVNLCQGGATTGQELAILTQYGLPLAPQFVISFNGANDLMHPAPVGDDDAPNLPYRNREMKILFEGRHGQLAHLALTRVAARLAQRLPVRAQEQDVPDGAIIDSYIYSLDLTRTLAESRGASYKVLLQPTLHWNKPWSAAEAGMWRERRPGDGAAISERTAQRYRAAGQALLSWGREHHVETYDLTHVFAQTADTVYSDSVHFVGETGYQVLFDALAHQGLIESITKRYRRWQTKAAGWETVSWAH